MYSPKVKYYIKYNYEKVPLYTVYSHTISVKP